LIHDFLDQCWLVCAIFSINAQGRTTAADYNRIVGREAKKFHRLGMPAKLNRLREDFSVTSEFEAHLLSINTARNCLVHRLGMVTDRDVDTNGELAILWRSFALVAQSPDGAQEISLDEPVVIEAGWTVIVRMTDKQKLFQKGERIELSYREITHIFSSLMSFAASLGKSIEEYYKKVCVRIPNAKAEDA
jgi:hypothetical protein